MECAVLAPGRTPARREGRPVPPESTTRIAGAADAEHILDLYRRLSPQSRFFRFLAPVPRLTPGLCHRLTDLDPDRVLVRLAFLDGRCVGEARLVRGEPGAELALAVADEHQRRGIGGELFRLALQDAAEHLGVATVDLCVHPQNRPMLRLLHAARAQLRLVDGSYEATLDVRGPARA